jgi:excinuclease UvrABC helicase subunit UvrB
MLSRVTLRHKLTALRMLSDVAYLEKRMHINARAERYDKAIEFRNKIEEAKKWNLKC